MTNAKRLAGIVMSGVFAAVAACLFVAPVIVRHQYAALSAGDPIFTRFSGMGVVESVDAEADTVTVRREDGSTVIVPTDEVTER